MIHIPPVRRHNSNHWKILALAMMFVVFMAAFFMASYYYVFGIKSPWQKTSYSQPTNVYVAPELRLENVIKSRFIK